MSRGGGRAKKNEEKKRKKEEKKRRKKEGEKKKKSENYHFLAKKCLFDKIRIKKKIQVLLESSNCQHLKTKFHYLKIVWLIARFGYLLRDQFKVFIRLPKNNRHFGLL